MESSFVFLINSITSFATELNIKEWSNKKSWNIKGSMAIDKIGIKLLKNMVGKSTMK